MSRMWSVVRRVGAVSVLLVLAGVMTGGCTRGPEPTYVGKPLSEWDKLLRDASEPTRRGASEALAAIGEPAVPYLVKALKEREPGVRIAALASLTELAGTHPEATLPAISPVSRLFEEDAACREEAAGFLRAIGAPAVPALVKALKNREVEVRGTAIGVLVRIGAGALPAVPALVEATTDQEVRVRMVALKALRTLDARADVVLPAVARLFEEDETCREEAAVFLEEIGEPAVPVWLRAKDSEPGIRRLAVRALVRMNPLPAGALELFTEPLGKNEQSYERFRWVPDGSVLVKLPGGSFTMGSASGVGSSDVRPAHTVTLSGFYMAEAEITWGQWDAYVAANPGAYNPSKSFTVTDDDPVHNVSWNDVQDYLTWAGLRLPTEAEWEYAARADRTGDIYATQHGTISHDLANYSGTGGLDTFGKTSPVKTFPANAFGLFDMSGNLWEWCADWYDSGYYATSPATDPSGPATGSARVIRGGSWDDGAGGTRAAGRVNSAAGGRSDGIGARPARSAP